MAGFVRGGWLGGVPRAASLPLLQRNRNMCLDDAMEDDILYSQLHMCMIMRALRDCIAAVYRLLSGSLPIDLWDISS